MRSNSSCVFVGEQKRETFLAEMVVVRENFGELVLAHRFHRNAIGEAVFLVRSGFVKLQPAQERVSRLWDDSDVGTLLNLSQEFDRFVTPVRSPVAEVCQKLIKDFVRGDDHTDLMLHTGPHRSLMPFILGIGKSGPIERIGEDSFHGRLSAPP